jgi:hypothetical protein
MEVIHLVVGLQMQVKKSPMLEWMRQPGMILSAANNPAKSAQQELA